MLETHPPDAKLYPRQYCTSESHQKPDTVRTREKISVMRAVPKACIDFMGITINYRTYDCTPMCLDM